MNNQLNNNNVNDNQLDHNNELNEILKLKKELNELYKNDKSYLEKVKKIDLNDKSYQIILIKICSYYDLIPPAYETIRENDVYLTTGMFYDIKFTSMYSYDLNQSKEEVSKSIFEYIENNWNEILEESNKRREGLFK
ncbi:hypothetical protein A0H76_421 [Hepatospora eriocheir]|uniref:Uncharacterized protein n=1 Tax=Hepatospora eriocheir TaxID=1081669 RepID=A0A1X0QAD5_9MICR|nr:hypothetical protein A0H76_421 [Hepatospora eriocheir]